MGWRRLRPCVTSAWQGICRKLAASDSEKVAPCLLPQPEYVAMRVVDLWLNVRSKNHGMNVDDVGRLQMKLGSCDEA